MNGLAQRGSELDWWYRYPALLQAELDAFERHGAKASIASAVFGYLILDVLWPTEIGTLSLRVGYCPTHPYGRVSVATSDLKLSRHQDPFSGTLCLLTQASDQGRPGEAAADLIASQLPRAIKAAGAHETGQAGEVADIEEQAPDPLTSYFDHRCEPDSIVLYDAGLRAPPGQWGHAEFTGSDRPAGGFEIVLRALKPVKGPWLASPFTPWKEVRPAKPFSGRWVRMKPTPTSDSFQLMAQAEAIIARDGAGPKAGSGAARKAQAEPELTVIIFDEEVEYGREGLGCLFLYKASQAKTDMVAQLRGRRIASDLLARTPASAGLKSKHVLLVGAGAIGSFVALELVRAGLGHLEVVDGDLLEPGNSVRWALGREYWGLPKAQALAHYAARHYPMSEVAGWVAKVGGAVNAIERAQEAGAHPLEWLRDRVQAADVILDATASIDCQLFLERFCREQGKPYILGHATEGAAGGVVVQFSPDRAGCRVCLSEHWADKTLPEPAVDSGGVLIPIGCNQPTFTGGAFDLQEVSLELVRAALGVLVPDLYLRVPSDLAVVDLEVNGLRITPRWVVHDLTPHLRCWACASA